jgi:hypothetical protein
MKSRFRSAKEQEEDGYLNDIIEILGGLGK